MSVSPTLDLDGNILFREIDVRSSKTKIILIHGLGTKLNPRTNTSGDKITLCNYASKGVLIDVVTLMKDLKTGEIKTRRKRLDDLISTIKTAISEAKYDQVVLIGCSHGSMIMYGALVEIEADITVPLPYLNKLRFYAISPPTFFPANTLSYNMLPGTLAFAHIHYKDDPFYNKSVQFPNTINNIFMKIAKKKVIHRVSSYYDQVLNTINGTAPANKCFFYDQSRQTLFLLPFLGSDNSLLTDKNYGYRYYVASDTLKGPLHASVNMLYPFMVYFEIATAVIQNISGGTLPYYVNILGRRRKIIVKGRWTYVTYKGKLITLNEARRLASM